MRHAVGQTTGVEWSGSIDNAIILDNSEVYDNVKKGMERIHGEYLGFPGFRVLSGRQLDMDLLIVQIPPYPQSVVEAVLELYLFGIRRIITVSRGYRLGSNVEPNTVVLAEAAIPMDSVSPRIAKKGLPLISTGELLERAKEIIDVRFSDLRSEKGFTITVDSPRLPWVYQDIEDYMGQMSVYSVDTVTAPLYALRYALPKLKALSMIIVQRKFSPQEQAFEANKDRYNDLLEREKKMESLLYIVALEIIHSLEVSPP
jgi:hypothetical protein